MNEVESLRQEIADIAEQLIGQIQRQSAAQEAQKGAWLMLLRHLSAQGYANLETVQRDLEMLADVQDDADFQDAYVVLSGAVQGLRGVSSAQPPNGRK